MGAPPKTLSQGSKGPDVSVLQQALNLLDQAVGRDFALLAVDGIFGPLTGKKVRAAQSELGIVVDGIVGPVTWSKIDDALMSMGIPGVIPGSKPPQWSFEFTKNDRPQPGPWDPEKSLNLFEMRLAIQRWNRSALSADMILVIFFEESLFCNMRQMLKKDKAGQGSGPGIGFGQMETGNKDKQAYYAWAGLPTDPEGTPYPPRGEKVAAQILGSKEEAVRIHVGYYNWLTQVHGKNRDGILSAQVGEHVHYMKLFIDGETKVRAAWLSRNRRDMINALNHARDKGKKNGIPWPRFSKFWRFIIPDFGLALVPPGWESAP